MTLLIGERYKERIAESLGALGVDVLWLPDNPDIDSRLAGHADLSVFVSDGHAVVAPGIYPYIDKYLTNMGRSISVKEGGPQGAIYPQDAGLCLCDTGKYMIYNPKTADPAAVNAIRNRQIVTVAQGYTKCAASIVNEHSIITADAGVWRAAKQYNINVLDITPGYIELQGFECGFIGGASFKLNEHMIAFTGTLDKHPDKDRILAFLAKHSQEPVFLTRDPVFDIGGAIALP